MRGVGCVGCFVHAGEADSDEQERVISTKDLIPKLPPWHRLLTFVSVARIYLFWE
jgi:hypothetical protein